MTQPVQEPTTYRAISRQGFVGRQLERRPAPITAGECPFPYVVRKMNSGQTIGAGGQENIVWDESDYSQAGGYFTNVSSDTFNIVEPSNPCGGGVYDFVAACHYDPEMNSMAQIKINSNAWVSSYMPTGWGKGGLYSSGGSLISGDDTIMVAFTARVVDGTSATTVIVGHENGSDQTLEWAFIRVARVCDWFCDGTGGSLAAEGDFPTLF